MKMAKKTALQKGLTAIATIILDQLDRLPPTVAKSKRKDLHRIAVNASRRAKRGKRSPLSRTRVPRPSTRSRSKTA
jgi:hypothetical protein